MKVLFVTINEIRDINDNGIYHDLLRKFVEYGHLVYVATALERKNRKQTFLKTDNQVQILNIKTLNIQKTNWIEKGIGTLLIGYQFRYAIKKYFPSNNFDLVLYQTPTITFNKVVSYIKKRDNAFAYLLLKDIFPQNAVDIDLFRKSSLIYKFFRNKEKELYIVSDKIGCMSPANVKYLLEHNKYIPESKVEVCPNSIEPIKLSEITVNKLEVRNKYNLPNDKIIFVYGGNLGQPQGIDFLIEVLESNKNNPNCFFLIVGDGTEYKKIETWFNFIKPNSARLIRFLPKNYYDNVLKACDVGMIFLDVRFTIPNFPSRMLSYMEFKLPIIASTDLSSDIKDTLKTGDFGFWSKSGNLVEFNKNLDKLSDKLTRERMGENARTFLEKNYTSDINYKIIMKNF